MSRRILLGAICAVTLGVAVFVPWGDLLLHRNVEGIGCVGLFDQDDLDFTSEFESENRLVNGSTIRTLAGDPSLDCTRIGAAYRCDVPSDTIVEVRLFDYTYVFDAKAGNIVFGNDRFADCFMPSDGVAG